MKTSLSIESMRRARRQSENTCPASRRVVEICEQLYHDGYSSLIQTDPVYCAEMMAITARNLWEQRHQVNILLRRLEKRGKVKRDDVLAENVKLRQENERFRDYLVVEATCPVCMRQEKCEDTCDFADRYKRDAICIERVRKVLRGES